MHLSPNERVCLPVKETSACDSAAICKREGRVQTRRAAWGQGDIMKWNIRRLRGKRECSSESQSIVLDDVYDIDCLLSRSFLISDWDTCEHCDCNENISCLEWPLQSGTMTLHCMHTRKPTHISSALPLAHTHGALTALSETHLHTSTGWSCSGP